jgi:2'-hydroxyisoflavone reductase
MNLLILGGTQFVGRHVVEAAQGRGHTVTTFTRGNNPLPNTESLIGDRRKGEYTALQGRTWDAVIDVNAYVPREVREAAAALQTRHYTFISTVSVYQGSAEPGIHEDSPLVTLEDPSTEAITGETYGGLKVLCEQEAQRLYPNCLIIRPHIVVGPHDPTDRFTYWPRRFAQQDQVLVPGKPEFTVQYIDARDQANFIVESVEQSLTGTFNSAAPSTTWGELVAACGGEGKAVWADEAWLLEQKVSPWADLPLWIPMGSEGRGLLGTDSSRALKAGLKIRPLEQTVQELLAWDRTRAGDLKAGLSAEREQDLLRAYASKNS